MLFTLASKFLAKSLSQFCKLGVWEFHFLLLLVKGEYIFCINSTASSKMSSGYKKRLIWSICWKYNMLRFLRCFSQRINLQYFSEFFSWFFFRKMITNPKLFPYQKVRPHLLPLCLKQWCQKCYFTMKHPVTGIQLQKVVFGIHYQFCTSHMEISNRLD